MIPNTIPWRERAYVSHGDAAAILARSPSWIRERIADGELRAIRTAKGGPTVVTVASVLSLIAKIDRKEQAAAQPDQTPAWPKLVWINPGL